MKIVAFRLFSDNSYICIISGSVSLEQFHSGPLVTFLCFLTCLIIYILSWELCIIHCRNSGSCYISLRLLIFVKLLNHHLVPVELVLYYIWICLFGFPSFWASPLIPAYNLYSCLFWYFTQSFLGVFLALQAWRNFKISLLCSRQ